MNIANTSFAGSVSDASVRMLQFTDTHLFADKDDEFDGINTYESFNQVLTLAKRCHWPPELVVITGDLVHDPVESAYQLLKSILVELQLPVYCIPGNHDDPSLMAEILPGESIKLIRRLPIKGWQVFFLNSYIPNTHSGHLAKEELEFLDDQLYSNRKIPALICLHHPPVMIGSEWMDAMSLRNADEFFAVIDGHKQVKGVLWGHIHQRFERERKGVKLLAAPSTCIQFTPASEHFEQDDLKAGYRWIVLTEDGQLETGINRLSEATVPT